MLCNVANVSAHNTCDTNMPILHLMPTVMINCVLSSLSPIQSFSPLLFVDVLSNQKKYHFNKLGHVFVEIQPPETLSSA